MRWAIEAARHVMIASIAAMFSVSLSGVPVFAQGTNAVSSTAAERQRQAQLGTLTKTVSLTPDQVTQVKAINEDAAKKMIALRNSGEKLATARPKIVAIQTEQQAKIRTLLADNQKPKFDAYIAKLPHGNRPTGPRRRGAATPPPRH